MFRKGRKPSASAAVESTSSGSILIGSGSFNAPNASSGALPSPLSANSSAPPASSSGSQSARTATADALDLSALLSNAGVQIGSSVALARGDSNSTLARQVKPVFGRSLE